MPTLTASASRLALAPADVLAHLARFDLTLADVLTTSNPKLNKGADLARAAILHHLPERALARAITPGPATTAPRGYLAPVARLAEREGLTAAAMRHQGCPWATAGCAAGCLVWAGHGGLSPAVAAARARRTLAYLADPATYGRAILFAVARELSRTPAGQPLAARLRGTDDLPWHRLEFRVDAADVAHLARRYNVAAFSGERQTLAGALALHLADRSLILYDYSKAPLAGPLGLLAQRGAGYRVTASFRADASDAVTHGAESLALGFNLAMPVMLARGQEPPRRVTLTLADGTAATWPNLNGDLHDHRWSDPTGHVVILRTKASRGADRHLADRFSLASTDEPQPLADGVIRLQWN